MVLDLGPARFQRRQSIAHRRARQESVGDLVDQPIGAAPDLGQVALEAGAIAGDTAGQALIFGVELSHRRLDHVGVQQLGPHGLDHPGVQIRGPGRSAVGAGVGAALAPRAAQIAAVGAAGDHRAVTAAAADQAGQQALRSPCPLGPRPAGRGVRDGGDAGLDRVPQIGVDDAQIRRLGADLLVLTGRPLAAGAGAAILGPGMTAPDHDAGIKLIVQQAVAASGVAVDGRGVPLPAARGRDLAGVQSGGDGAGRCAGGIVAEHRPDDLGGRVVDGQQAGQGFARRIELAPPAIAIGGRTAGVTALAGDPGLAPARLPGQFLQEQGIHRALQPDVQGLGLALGQGVDRHARGLQVVIDVPGVAAGTGQAVQGFADHDIEAAALRGGHQGPEARPVDGGGARDRGVVEFRRHGRAHARREGAAGDQLVLDRRRRLQVAGETGVKGGAHG